MHWNFIALKACRHLLARPMTDTLFLDMIKWTPIIIYWVSTTVRHLNCFWEKVISGTSHHFIKVAATIVVLLMYSQLKPSNTLQ